MTTKAHHAAKRHRKSRFINLILAVILGTLLFFVFKEAAKGISRDQADRGKVQSGASSMEGYDVLDKDSTDLAMGDLVLVNRTQPYVFPKGLKLVSIYDQKNDCYFVRDKDVLIDKSIMGPLNDMMEAFARETGARDVNVVAGHRTYAHQEKLYNDSLAAKGAEHTEQYVALPGCSEHHTGLAVDFAIYHSATGKSEEFSGGAKYGWFGENAWRYGFILRFSSDKSDFTKVADEPWHFRYVGVPHAYYMQQNNLCLEEYIDLLSQYPCDGAHLKIDTGDMKYEVYYCAGTQAHVPEKAEYSISGNNIDGFIVTVDV